MPKHASSTAYLKATRCIGCAAKGRRTELSKEAIARGDWWCERCKDASDMIGRFRLQQDEARQRLQATYPAVTPQQMFLGDDL